jgi:hypothetical protein
MNFMNKFKLDYWKMTDSELLDLATEYQLLEETDIELLSYNFEKKEINPNYERNLLSQGNREKIISGLTGRIRFFGFFIIFFISVVSLIISILALSS